MPETKVIVKTLFKVGRWWKFPTCMDVEVCLRLCDFYVSLTVILFKVPPYCCFRRVE